MASLSEQKVQSCGDHRGHGQREQDDAVQEHRGSCRFQQRQNKHTLKPDQTSSIHLGELDTHFIFAHCMMLIMFIVV